MLTLDLDEKPAFLDGSMQISENVHLIEQMPSGSEIKAWGATLPGFLWVNEGYIAHSVGPYSTYYLLNEPEVIAQDLHSYRVQEFVGAKVGPTYGSQARKLMRWLNWHYEDWDYTHLADMVKHWHYQHAQPRKKIPFGRMFDISGAYWQFVKRLPAPVVIPYSSGRLKPIRFTNSRQEEKWNACALFLDASPKLFKQVFVGVCAGSVLPSQNLCFHRGEEMSVPINRPSALAGTACTVIRTCYEVTQQQALAFKSAYANVDCVLAMKKTAEPEVWKDLGIEYKVTSRGGQLAEGPADVRGAGFWKVGNVSTKSYQKMPEGESGNWFQKTVLLDTDTGKPLLNERGRPRSVPGVRSPELPVLYSHYLTRKASTDSDWQRRK